MSDGIRNRCKSSWTDFLSVSASEEPTIRPLMDLFGQWRYKGNTVGQYTSADCCATHLKTSSRCLQERGPLRCGKGAANNSEG